MSNKSTLIALFQTGDVPTGTDYADLINSNLNLNETTTQTCLGPINPTELVTSRVSAGNGNFTGTLSASTLVTNTISFSTVTATNAVLATTSAVSVYSDNYFHGTGIVSATGTTQATATNLTFSVNRVAGLADGSATGVSLLSNRTGLVQYVINGTVSANLWPCVGGAINALASNAAFGMTANTLYTIVHTKASAYAVK